MAQTKEEKAAAEKAAAEAAAAPVETIEFFGPGREVTIRILTQADFEKHEIPQKQDFQWDASNGWMIPLDEFAGRKDDVRAFFMSQGDFRIAEHQYDAQPEEG